MKFRSPAGPHPLTRLRLAFTLVELLVVMTIAALVIGLTVPAVNSLLGGRAVGNGINDVTGILEFARVEAMARHTYVYVPFVNAVNSDGNSEIRVAAAVSKSGLNSWGGNLQPLTKVVKVTNMQHAKFAELPDTMRTYITNSAADLSGAGNYLAETQYYKGFNVNTPPNNVPFIVNGQNFDDAVYVAFSPQGELMTGGDDYNVMFKTLICIGLAPTRGKVVQMNAKDAAVITFYGGSAKFRFTRP